MEKIKKFITIILTLAVLIPISAQNTYAITGEALNARFADTIQSTDKADTETPPSDSNLIEAANLTSQTDNGIIAENEDGQTETNDSNTDTNGEPDKKDDNAPADEYVQPTETPTDNNNDNGEQPATDEEQFRTGNTKQLSLDVPENKEIEQPAIYGEQNETGEEFEKDVAQDENEIKPEVLEEESLENAEEGIEPLAVSGDWEYTDNSDGTVTITKYTGTDIEVTVPNILNGKNVRELKSEYKNNTYIPCFNSSIKAVTILQGVLFCQV